MKRNLRKKFAALVMASLSVITVCVSATTYTSSLSLDFRSTNTGTTRSYQGPAHQIALTLTQKGSQSATNDNYCMVTLQQKSGSSYVSKPMREVNLKAINGTERVAWSDQSDGDYRYYFSNRYVSSDSKYNKVTDFYCNTVTMASSY